MPACSDPRIEEETTALKFSEGQEVRVRGDGHLEDGVKQYRGRNGTIDHVVVSPPELTFYCVTFSGEWDKGHIRESALEPVVEDNGPCPGSPRSLA